MGFLRIQGTDEHLKTLVDELEEEGIPVSNRWDRIGHITLWNTKGSEEVVCYYHKEEDISLAANLPSHRKHFIDKAKEVLN